MEAYCRKAKRWRKRPLFYDCWLLYACCARRSNPSASRNYAIWFAARTPLPGTFGSLPTTGSSSEFFGARRSTKAGSCRNICPGLCLYPNIPVRRRPQKAFVTVTSFRRTPSVIWLANTSFWQIRHCLRSNPEKRLIRAPRRVPTAKRAFWSELSVSGNGLKRSFLKRALGSGERGDSRHGMEREHG
jgi:hypothetical protein